MVTVDGTGSAWSTGQSLVVGDGGNGTLNVTRGGAVSSSSSGLSFIGTGDPGSTGVVTVDGPGSIWTDSGGVVVGNCVIGTLSITRGGAVSSGSGNIGDGSVSACVGWTGIVTVDGTGSKWTNSGGLQSGATLNITRGGAVSDTTGDIGGVVTVEGVGSKWTNSGGLQADGTLNISGGGTVSNTNASVGSQFGGIRTVTVKGTGSKWTNNGYLRVGDYEYRGTLNISRGGAASDTSGYIGYDRYTTGVVTVNGSGSKWTNSGTLYVGNLGIGTLDISGGGAVSDTIGYLGYAASSTGVAVVKAPGSKWTNGGALYVGKDGTGTLKVRNGGVVTAKSVSINSKSVLSIDVGNNSLLNVDSGRGAIVNNGTVRIMAGAGPAAYANYKPISAATWTGSGAYQALGGRWNTWYHAFTVSAIQSTVSGIVARFDLSSLQRVLTTYGTKHWTVGTSFMSAAVYKAMTFTATAIGGASLTGLQKAAGGGESVLGGWQFSATNYATTCPEYLSFDIGTGHTPDQLELWHCTNNVWKQFTADDLNCNGKYASFMVSGFGGYAVTADIPSAGMSMSEAGSLGSLQPMTTSAVPEPSALALLLAAGLAMLGYVWRRRARE